MNEETRETCDYFLEQLEQYVAGKLGSDAEAAVQAHVETCSYCQGWLNGSLDAARENPWLHRLRDISAVDVEDVSFLERVIEDYPRATSSANADSKKFRSHLIRCIATCVGSLATVAVVIAVFIFGPPSDEVATRFLAFLMVTAVLLFFMGLVTFISPVLEVVAMQSILKIKEAEATNKLNAIEETLRENVDPTRNEIVISVDARLGYLFPDETEVGV